MSFKRSQIGLRVGQKVSPDEMDAYTVYTVNNPSTALLAPLFVASAGTAGTSTNTALVINNKFPDYPRNVQFAIAGTGAGMAGTLTINGFDQFGSAVTETMAFATASNGGTVVGTRVFGQFTSGTVNYGTAVGSGTPSISFSPGTDCRFGLPVKIGAATDVIHYGMSAGTGPISVGGGTAIGSLVDTGMHAVRPFAAFGGTTFFNFWVRSSFNAEEANVALGTQPS